MVAISHVRAKMETARPATSGITYMKVTITFIFATTLGGTYNRI